MENHSIGATTWQGISDCKDNLVITMEDILDDFKTLIEEKVRINGEERDIDLAIVVDLEEQDHLAGKQNSASTNMTRKMSILSIEAPKQVREDGDFFNFRNWNKKLNVHIMC